MTGNDGYDDFASEEFIRQPSRFSEHTLKIAKEAAAGYSYLLDQKTFFQKLKKGIKLRLEYLNKYKESYSLVSDFNPEGNSIKDLYEEFRKLSSHIALNNILLAYAMTVEKDHSASVLTKEDEKMLALKRLKSGENKREEFDKAFGHHGLNPFEVSSERFSEYSDKKLMMMAENIPEPKTEGKTSMEEYLKSRPKKLFPVYNALREEFRDKGILIISKIRERLLELQKKHKIKDIFSKSYEEVISYEQD